MTLDAVTLQNHTKTGKFVLLWKKKFQSRHQNRKTNLRYAAALRI